MVSANRLLPFATKLQRSCFYICLSFCSQGGLPQCMLGYHPLPRVGTLPRAGIPPRAGPRPQAPPRTRYLPDQAPPGNRRLLLRTVCILLECILVSIVLDYTFLLKVLSCELILFCVLSHRFK